MSGVDTADFALTGLGTISSVIQLTTTTYRVDVTTGADGDVRLDFIDNDTVTDVAGNPAGGVGTVNGDFTTGETYTIDKTAPTVLSIVRAGTNPTNAATVDFTVTFSESVTGVAVADFASVPTGLTGTLTVASVTAVNGSTYKVTVNAGTGEGTLGLDFTGNVTDLASNNSTATYNAGQVYTIDRTAPAAPGVALTSDTGSSNSDKVTSNGALTLSGVEGGATVQYSIDGGTTWTSTFTPVQGLNSVEVRQTDVAGNIGPSSGAFTFTFDTVPPAAPGISLTSDTGSSSSDKITSNGALTLSGVEVGATAEYSTDGGATWNPTFTAAEGANSVQVRQTDVAGNVSTASAAFTFTLDTVAPAVPTVALTSDTGSSPIDKITSNGALTLTGVEGGASVQYSVDGGTTWSNTFTPVQGANSVEVRQTDVAGNVGPASAAFAFTLDTIAPVAPGVALTVDTGSNNADKITSNGALTLTGVESGASVEYSIDGGTTWLPTFTATEGANSVEVRQTDVAGNVSIASIAFAFTLDTTVPAAPTVALTADTGFSGADKITSNGALTLTGVEPGATVQYSIDGGTTWTGSFTPVQGANSVQVRQTDVAGNVGTASAAFTFTLDTIAPAMITISDIVPNVRSTSVTNVDVTFSESIALTTLTFADLILSRDGSVNLINAGSGVVITQDLGDPTIYHVALPAALTSTSGGYSLKVVGAGIADAAGNASSGNLVATWTMSAASTAAPGTPTILTPIGVLNDVTPTFTWTATSLAARYDLWVDNLTTGASQVIRQTSLVATTFTPVANLPYGSYRVWVRAFNGSDVASSWSTSADFRIGAPTITAPIGTAPTNPPRGRRRSSVQYSVDGGTT
ncbi:MAG: Ig-like domain-containing protein [Gemmataceae bacterium]